MQMKLYNYILVLVDIVFFVEIIFISTKKNIKYYIYNTENNQLYIKLQKIKREKI